MTFETDAKTRSASSLPRKSGFACLELTSVLEESCRELGVTCHQGPTWTTDPPYRETPSRIAYLANQGILGVDIESSALFSIGILRGAKVACILAASSNLVVPRAKLGPFYHSTSKVQIGQRRLSPLQWDASIKAVEHAC